MSLLGRYQKRSPPPDRGAKTRESTNTKGADYYTVIASAQAAAAKHVLLIESGFHDNAQDEAILLTESNLAAMADIQARVICKYIGADMPAQTPPTSTVTPDQNNYCGMGVTSTGVKGNSFKTAAEGIRAQIQHLKAYANKEPLNSACIDPRFTYVTRGVAPYVEWLGAKENPQGLGWAMGADYGAKILKILAAILAVSDKPATFTPYTVKVTTDDLNIRSGAGTNYGVCGAIKDRGIYTIVEEANGAGAKRWGRLKSGAGWISLDFTQKM